MNTTRVEKGMLRISVKIALLVIVAAVTALYYPPSSVAGKEGRKVQEITARKAIEAAIELITLAPPAPDTTRINVVEDENGNKRVVTTSGPPDKEARTGE